MKEKIMVDWRTQAKELGISLYHRTKADVLKDIEQKSNQPKKKIEITRNEASEICRKAFKEYAIEQGLDPDNEILISRWYLDMNRSRMTFIGKEKDDGSTGSDAEQDST